VAFAQGNPSRSMVTGADGKFRFEGVPAGKYRLSAERLGFTRQYYKERVLYAGYQSAVVTGEGLAGETLTFAMIPGSALTGKIVDQMGNPVEGLDVLAIRVSGSGTHRHVVRYQYGRTDDRGYYRIHSLSAGDYIVAMYAAWSQPLQSEERAAAFPVTYHPGVGDPNAAQLVRLEPGKDTRVDATVQAVSAGTLTGEIYGAARPGSQVSLSIVGPYGSNFGWGPRATVAKGPSEKFTYHFDNLPPARYALYLWEGAHVAGQRDIEVRAGDNNVNLTESEPTRVSAKVLIHATAGRPVGNAVVALRRVGITGTYSRAIDADGKADMGIVSPGKYEVFVTNGRMFAMESVTARGAMVEGVNVEIPETGSVELNIVVDAAAAEVTGHTFRGSQPEAGMLALLVPKDGLDDIASYRIDQSDSDGSFVWHSVGRGEYLMFVLQEGEPGDYFDPVVVRSLLSQAFPLTIGDGPPPDVTLQVAEKKPAKTPP
jgi:protocatechuate 3,4-dioxygenase beta subunit